MNRYILFNIVIFFIQINFKYKTLESIGFINTAVISQIVPCFILLVSTVAILVKLRGAKQRKAALKSSITDRTDQTENALLAILILFLICELPFGIILLLNMFDERFSPVTHSLFPFTVMLRLLNASLNFILYCTMFIVQNNFHRSSIDRGYRIYISQF